MAEAVTYADLRFAPSRPARPAPDEVGDGELTYENFSPSAQDPRRPTTGAQAAARPCRLPLCSAAPLALLGAGLVLLAACVGLGVRYGQVSQELQRASRRQEAESSRLAGTISGQERNLTRAQADLDATRRALWHSWQAGNDTRRQLERELRAARSNLTLLQREKDDANRQLEDAASCRQIGCCPPGWKLFRWRCLWVSDAWETWERSRQNCDTGGARLLVFKGWNAATVWEAIGGRGHLQATELWIGLTGQKISWNEWSWYWLDCCRSLYERTELASCDRPWLSPSSST
uniref:Uncharacterized protein n=1 Tax=Sphaerodactylus townsendi TaxID=933632 RepID=A0ACB8EP24_9SAUR